MAGSRFVVAAVTVAASLMLGGCPSDTCSCGPGQVENTMASGKVYCCSGATPYYCSGNGLCYSTWEGAYYANPAGCTLPKERYTCPGTDDSCAPDCATGTHQVGCSCVPN